MRVVYTKAFKKDFQEFPKAIQKIAETKLEFFVDNFRHQSLQVKKMEGYPDIWEGRISGNYRFTFQIIKDIYFLRRIGTHDILKRP